jgi:hypothetical protein
MLGCRLGYVRHLRRPSGKSSPSGCVCQSVRFTALLLIGGVLATRLAYLVVSMEIACDPGVLEIGLERATKGLDGVSMYRLIRCNMMWNWKEELSV